MSRIVLMDPKTKVEIEFSGDPMEGWSLRDAVQELTNKIVEQTKITPHEVLFSNEPFRICLRDV